MELENNVIENDGEQGGERDFEAEARKLGWKSADEFQGDPAKLVDAKTFVERGEEMLPLLKRQLADAKKEQAQLKRTMRQFAEFHNKTEERAYARAMEDLQKRQDDAVEVGDVQAARKVTEDMRALEREVASKPKIELPDDDDAAVLAEAPAKIQKWVEDSEWYFKDEGKTKYADLQSDMLIKKHGALHKFPGGLDAALKEIEARVDAKFSDRPPTVTNGVGNRAPAKGGKSYADLPAEAKRQCDRFVKTIPGFTKEAYVKDFDWGN